MAKLPTCEEMGKKAAEEALDGYVYKGKTLREWIELLAQTRWIPVSEKLPEEDGQYLACTDDGYVATLWYDITVKMGWLLSANVIAWMPLPEPPEPHKEESEG